MGFAAQHTYYDVWDGPNMVNTFENAKDANAWLKENDPDKEFERIARDEAEPLEHALHIINIVIEKMLDKFGTKEYRVYESCPTPENWRTEFYTEYKANRKPRVCIHNAAIKEFLADKWGSHSEKGMEADDAISMDAWSLGEMKRDYVVITIDKDMKQIPGRFYDWTKDEETVISHSDAIEFLGCQIIAGDSVDNIKGIPRMGMIKAEKWLDAYEGHRTHPELKAWACYQEYYEDKDEADYRFHLNRALVSLPRNLDMLRSLKHEVKTYYGKLQEKEASKT